MNLTKLNQYAAPAGRILIGVFFLLAGIDKIMNLEGTAGYIGSVGLPAASLLALATALFEISAGLILISGKWTKYVALGLVLFIIAVTATFHAPSIWVDNPMQQVLFMKNVALIGGLLFMFAHSGMEHTEQRA